MEALIGFLAGIIIGIIGAFFVARNNRRHIAQVLDGPESLEEQIRTLKEKYL